jgi:uncharacterized BrkB/YihY/UPF0761 family membrane protein
MSQPVELINAASLVSLAALCALLLRRLVRADRLHALRVAVITALLWVGACYLFSLACSDIFQTGCDVISFESDVYTCTES